MSRACVSGWRTDSVPCRMWQRLPLGRRRCHLGQFALELTFCCDGDGDGAVVLTVSRAQSPRCACCPSSAVLSDLGMRGPECNGCPIWNVIRRPRAGTGSTLIGLGAFRQHRSAAPTHPSRYEFTRVRVQAVFNATNGRWSEQLVVQSRPYRQTSLASPSLQNGSISSAAGAIIIV